MSKRKLRLIALTARAAFVGPAAFGVRAVRRGRARCKRAAESPTDSEHDPDRPAVRRPVLPPRRRSRR